MTPPRDELLTVRELADRWSMTPQRVDAMIRDGLPLASKGRPRRVSLKAAEAFRDGYTGADGRGGRRPGAGRRKAAATTDAPSEPVQAPPAADEPPRGSLVWEKLQEARLRREKLQREADKAAGELVPVAMVRPALIAHVDRARRELERHAPRVTSKILAALGLRPEVRTIVERLISEDVAETVAKLSAMPPLAPAPEPGR